MKGLQLYFLVALSLAFSLHVNICLAQDWEIPKKFLVILAHPNESSLNHSIANTVGDKLKEQGHEVMLRDLYALEFQPVLSLDEWKNYGNLDFPTSEDVQKEQMYLLWADHLIFVYPTWWWGPPAVLKGYLDRVFTPGFAFSVGPDGIKGKLAPKKVSVLQTTGSEEAFVRQNQMDDSVRKLMGLGIFEFCGLEVVHHEFFTGINGKTYEELKGLVSELELWVERWF